MSHSTVAVGFSLVYNVSLYSGNGFFTGMLCHSTVAVGFFAGMQCHSTMAVGFSLVCNVSLLIGRQYPTLHVVFQSHNSESCFWNAMRDHAVFLML